MPSTTDNSWIQQHTHHLLKRLAFRSKEIPSKHHKNDFPEDQAVSRLSKSFDDNVVHDPLGAGSYLYQDQEDFLTSTLRNVGALIPTGKPKTIIVHIGAQPNNSPHAGTIVTFALAFLVARESKRQYEAIFRKSNPGCKVDPLDVRISLDLVDTAPDSSKTENRDGVVYQRSHRATAAMEQFLPDYDELLTKLSDFVDTDISVKKTRQVDLLSGSAIPRVLDAIIRDHERLGKELSPSKGKLALRSACPEPKCGRADKHGIKTQFIIGNDIIATDTETRADHPTTDIIFHCPDHGPYTASLSSPEHIKTLEFNTPLRNLVRTIANGLETMSNPEILHMRITGADYSGQYQEQMLYRPLLMLPIARGLPPPVIIYAPLITDWSGAKLSKSLYVKNGAYEYLENQGMDFLLSYHKMKEMGQDVSVLFKEVETWIESPKKLFRSHSIVYLLRVFESAQKDATC